MMIVAVVMSAVVISSCSKDDDDSNNSNIPNNTIVWDGVNYQIQAVKLSGSKPESSLTFYNSTSDIKLEIKGKEAFSTVLKEQTVEIEIEKGGVKNEIYTPIKICYDGGSKYQVLFSNIKMDNHTLSVSFNGDAKDFPVSNQK